MDCTYRYIALYQLENNNYNYCLTLTYSCTHSHTDGGVSHARRQAEYIRVYNSGVEYIVPRQVCFVDVCQSDGEVGLSVAACPHTEMEQHQQCCVLHLCLCN